jgi:hypothetical protein
MRCHLFPSGRDDEVKQQCDIREAGGKNEGEISGARPEIQNANDREKISTRQVRTVFMALASEWGMNDEKEIDARWRRHLFHRGITYAKVYI